MRTFPTNTSESLPSRINFPLTTYPIRTNQPVFLHNNSEPCANLHSANMSRITLLSLAGVAAVQATAAPTPTATWDLAEISADCSLDVSPWRHECQLVNGQSHTLSARATPRLNPDYVVSCDWEHGCYTSTSQSTSSPSLCLTPPHLTLIWCPHLLRQHPVQHLLGLPRPRSLSIP
jgi:hypothetical protein